MNSPLRTLTPPQLRSLLDGHGLGAGMAALNAGVPHRYTAIYRVAGDLLFNVFVHDKQGEVRPEVLAVVNLGESFCQFVLRDGALLTDDSNQESLLAGSPFRGVVVAYHGVPVADNAGGLYGTLCHFDLVQRSLPAGQFQLLEAAGKMLFPYVRHLRGDADAAPAPAAP